MRVAFFLLLISFAIADYSYCVDCELNFHDNKCMAHFVIIYLFHFIQTDKSYLILSTRRALTHTTVTYTHPMAIISCVCEHEPLLIYVCVCGLRSIRTLDLKFTEVFHSLYASLLRGHYRSDDYYFNWTRIVHTSHIVQQKYRNPTNWTAKSDLPTNRKETTTKKIHHYKLSSSLLLVAILQFVFRFIWFGFVIVVAVGAAGLDFAYI